MNKKEYSIAIKATKETVWFSLWDDWHYRSWTNVFCEGSHAISDWKQGSKIQFVTSSGGGMYSIIDRIDEFSMMRFKHLGEIKNFEEQDIDDKTKSWTGAIEEYVLEAQEQGIILKVKIDVLEEHENYFDEVFPKAFQVVKDLAENFKIVVTSSVYAPIDKVWNAWTNPEDICRWNAASDDWHTPKASNDLKVGGSFISRMESKDGSMGFDFSGIYTVVDVHTRIEYFMEDGRKVSILFESKEDHIKITESFDPEIEHSFELQKMGWQSILDSFKKYLESK